MVTLAVAVSFVLATALGVSGFVAQRGAIAFGATTTLTIVGGDVSVSGDGVTFEAATDGAVLRVGTTIHTSASGYAVITYFDGSTVSVDPSTTLTISALGLEPDGATTITMRQDIGRTWHSVQRLLSGSSRYEVTTPTMTASVRGTMFAVGVATDAQGQTVSTVDTAEGVVAAAKPAAVGQTAQEVLVRPGFRATVTQNGPIDPPVPSRDPDRTITITIGAGAGMVVDGVGRSNGVIGERVIAQTPGARIERRGGELVVRLPDLPDGQIVAVVHDGKVRTRTSDVTAVLEEKGQVPRSTTTTVTTSGGREATVSIDVRTGQLASRSTSSSDRKKKDDQGGPGSGGPGGFAPNAQLPSLPNNEPPPAPDGARNGDRSGGGGFVPSAPLPDLPSLTGQTSRDPVPRPGAPSSSTDPRSGSDRGGGGSRPDTKGKP